MCLLFTCWGLLSPGIFTANVVLGYMAKLTSDPTTSDQLAYARLLIKEAQRHDGLGWLDYDQAFRQQIATDPSIRWNILVPGLQAATIIGHPLSQGLFCTLCRGVDHSRAKCALSCLEPSVPATSTVATAVRRRPKTNVCVSWNRGSCLFPGDCAYRHE